MSAGTARNLPFYPKRQLTSLTLTDSSRGMLFFARDKAAQRPMGVPVAVHQCDARHLAASPSIGLGDAAGPGAQAAAARGGAVAGSDMDSRREPAAAAPQPAEPASARGAGAGGRAAPAAAAAPQAAATSAGMDPRAGLAERPAAVEVAAVPREGEHVCALVPALRVFEPGTFTTVVDTFGLCSHSDPVGTLRVGPRP